jgi:uncharacterized protein YbjT (DUF2867 family)
MSFTFLRDSFYLDVLPLTVGDHAGATYTLTGPEALTLSEVAAVISEETGRTVTFHDETTEVDDAIAASWERHGLPVR